MTVTIQQPKTASSTQPTRSQANPQGRLSKFLVALMRALAGCAV
jgi:hypothetical protein